MEPLGILSKHVPIVFTDELDYYGECDGTRFVFTQAWKDLDRDEQFYVCLHELAHYLTSGSHDDAFYACLTGMIEKYKVDWKLACRIEQVYPHGWVN